MVRTREYTRKRKRGYYRELTAFPNVTGKLTKERPLIICKKLCPIGQALLKKKQEAYREALVNQTTESWVTYDASSGDYELHKETCCNGNN